MSGPWIIASPLSAATRWLDDQGISLLARVTGARSVVVGDLSRARGSNVISNGQASVSGLLGIHRSSEAAAAGQTTVAGILGHLFVWEGGQASGLSMVSGSLMVGQLETIAASTHGDASVAGNLSVDVPWRPTGEHVPDSDHGGGGSGGGGAGGSGGHPSRSPRSDGKGRRFFTPRSVGQTNGTKPC